MIFNLTTPAVSKLPKFTYTGDYELIDDGGKNWRIKFLTSGVLTLTKPLVVDVFLVGGGGGGPYQSRSSGNRGGNSGGSSGYTATQKSVTLEAGNYDIIIGAGGNGGTDAFTNQATAGGSSSAFGFSVNGGKRGASADTLPARGVAGGSGSGAGGYATDDERIAAGNGGSGGSDGGKNALNYQGGTGQGTTTREFGETTGDLYAGAGAGGGAEVSVSRYAAGGIGGDGGGGDGGTIVSGTPTAGGAGATNTGSGGGAGYVSNADSRRCTAGGAGGSGIVIMRNHREVAA